MSVVNHWVVQDPPETDGSGQRIVTYVYEFHNGDFRQRSFRRPAEGFDYDTEADGLVASVEQGIIDEEVDGYVEFYSTTEKNLNPIDVLPIHPETDSDLVRQRRFRRRLLRRWLGEVDIKKIRRLIYPIWYWLKFESGYTPQQIADYLGVTLGQLSAFDTRLQAYHDHLSFIDGEIAQDID